MALTEVLNLFGEITEEWFVFAVERCPYNKIISMANMLLGFKQYQQSGKAMESDIDKLKSKISEIIENKKIENVKNIELYKDHEGHIKTHFLRFENLHEDIEKIMTRLHITEYPKIPHLKKGISSNNIELFDVFSKDQLIIINDIFQEEFDLYGYEMVS